MKTIHDVPIQPLDLLLFRGFDPVSHAIQFVENSKIGRGDYSHAGLAMTREALDLPFLEPGKIYVWESVLSAKAGFWANFSDKIPDAEDNRVRFGIQLRDLELVIPGYYGAGGQVAWCAFRGERPPIEDMRRKLLALHEQYGHARFPVNLLNFFSTVFPALRTPRDRLNRAHDNVTNVVNRLLQRAGKQAPMKEAEQHLFCSEWVARVYKELDLFEIPDPRNAAPVHFLTKTSLFADPVPVVPEDIDPATAARLRTLPSSAPREDLPRRRARAARARFLQHQGLQERLREHAKQRASSVSMSDDGRVAIQFGDIEAEDARAAEGCIAADAGLDLRRGRVPLGANVAPAPISIAILVAGRREAVESFIAIGKRLKSDGHRVRLATHAMFRDLVESSELEFYPLGGDPKELIAYVLQTGGKPLRTDTDKLLGDATDKQRSLEELIESTWAACTQKDPGRPAAKPFSADAIISNPPTFGHVHVAEALNVPLHLMFTAPWSPTRAFPHAIANLDFERHGAVENYLSFGVVDMLMWSGMSRAIEKFRKETLGLPAVGVGKGPGLLNDATVPFCYLWSPTLIARPEDWADHIDISDFVLPDQSDDYEPPADLVAFLDKGDPPIYVGFGSSLATKPEEVTQTIFAALEAAGRRGVVAAEWGRQRTSTPPDNVYLVDDCRYDWLFPRCAAVCHHGEPEITAAGLRAGRPTVAVPFFADQPFWAAMVKRTGAGPAPVPIAELTVERLAEAFRACEAPEIVARAAEIGETLRARDGTELTVQAFYRHLPTTASGIAAYVGFNPEDRQRIRAGEVVTRRLEEGSSTRVGVALAARIDKPIEDVYEACLEGVPVERNPQTLAFGKLGDRDPDSTDFEAVGYTADETDEVAGLLGAEAGGPFNLSLDEIARFQELGRRFPGTAPSAEAIDAVNAAVRGLLLDRCLAYRRGGIEAIAPYARAGGEVTRPDELLRVAVPPDTVLAQELPEFHRALIDYPKNSLNLESRFFWVKQAIDGHPTFMLAHHMHVLGDGLSVIVARRFYVGRGVNVQQVVGGLVPLDGGTLLLCAQRVIGEQLAGLTRGARRSRQRTQMEEAARNIVEALRHRDAH